MYVNLTAASQKLLPQKWIWGLLRSSPPIDHAE